MTNTESQTAEVIYNIDLLNSQNQDYPLVSNLPKEPLYAFEFIGRKDEIGYIKNIITCGKGGYKLSIEGVGGLGKSTLAYEICEQLIKEKAINVALWFTAKDEDFTINLENYKGNFFDTISFLKEAITLLGYPSIDIKEKYGVEELKKLFKQILSKQCLKGKIIFVLDNLETVKDQSFFDLINEMRLFQGDFYLLITSRNSLSLNNENNIVIKPFSRDDMIKIIDNFKKFFKLGKLKLDIDTIINYCSGNPLISRIIIQKMVYSNTHQIYNDYIKNSGEKKQEILTYIFKNTFDNLQEESKYFLLILAHFDSVDEYILIEIENVFKEYFGECFGVLSIIEKELSKTFFIVYTPSNTSSFGIEKILLEDFVKSFLLSLQTNEATDLYSRINIEIIKKDQRYIKYKKIAEDYGARNKLESSEISKIIDLESEFKKRSITLEQFLEKLKREEKLYPNIPYINLVISKTIKNFNNGISEAIIYGEKALNSARRNLKETKFLQHYIYNLLGLYGSSKLYDKIYELSKELISLGIFKIETFNKIVRHELNIGEVEKAYNSATYGFNIIKDDINRYFKDSKFELENFLIHYYKSASAVGEFGVIEKIYSIIKNLGISYDGDLHFNINDDFENIKKVYEEGGIERLKSHQLIKIYKKRYEKDFIDKTEFIDFLENRSKVDSENGYIHYNLYKLTSNVDHLYLATKYSPNEEKYLIDICIELTKYGGERIGEILKYADKGITLNPDNICFFGYKGLYFSKKGDIENAIKNFEKGIENYNKLENNQKMNTFNKKNYETILENLDKNRI